MRCWGYSTISLTLDTLQSHHSEYAGGGIWESSLPATLNHTVVVSYSAGSALIGSRFSVKSLALSVGVEAPTGLGGDKLGAKCFPGESIRMKFRASSVSSGVGTAADTGRGWLGWQ